MVSALITGLGAAASLGSAIYGSIASAKQNKRANQLIDTMRTDNKKWYDTEVNKDYLQRSDTQAILKKQKELLDAQYNTARASNVVSGGTDEALAMQKEAANQTLADTMTNIASQASAHKDAVGQQYQQQNAALTQQQVQAAQNQANQIAQAAGQGVSAGLNLIGTGIGVEKIKK